MKKRKAAALTAALFAASVLSTACVYGPPESYDDTEAECETILQHLESVPEEVPQEEQSLEEKS